MDGFESPAGQTGGDDNPFAAPESDVLAAPDAPAQPGDAEEIRNKYLSAEASVRAIGTLNIFASFLLTLVAVGTITANVNRAAGPAETGAVVGQGIFLLILATLSFIVGRGLRALKNWARITAAIVSLPGIINPIVWVVLYQLLCKKGAYVCTPEYALVREATPHIRYKTSFVVKVLLVLVLVLSLLAFTAPLFNPHRRRAKRPEATPRATSPVSSGSPVPHTTTGSRPRERAAGKAAHTIST